MSRKVFLTLLLSFIVLPFLFASNPFDLPVGVVFIDPGHGGIDPGAVGFDVEEKDITLAVALLVNQKLQETGVTTVMTRTDDSTVSLEQRAAVAYLYEYPLTNSALFVSIHANSAPTSPEAAGFEILVSPEKKVITFLHAGALKDVAIRYADLNNSQINEFFHKSSLSFANNLKESLGSSFPSLRDRGIKDFDGYVLNCCRVPCALIEMGFLSNKEENAKLSDPKFQEGMAQAITNAILNYMEN